MLPAEFSAEALYTTVAGLSYTGDWRMVFGENPHKVANIVQAQLPLFHALYGPVLAASFPTVRSVAAEAPALGPPPLSRAAASAEIEDEALRGLRFQQDVSPEARLALGLSLPLRVQKRMAAAHLRSLHPPPVALAAAALASFFPSLWSSGAACSPAAQPFQKQQQQQLLLSPRTRVSMLIAEEGRALLSRLRQQRLQALIASSERWLDRLGSMRARVAAIGLPVPLTQASGGVARAGAGTALDSDAAARWLLRVARLTVESDGTSPIDFVRARKRTDIVAFWETMLLQSQLPSAAVGDLGVAAVPYLRPAIAHIVGSHARTQSIKGILTAGPVKATAYAASKLRKYFAVLLGLRLR